jgi:hypothetical protein
VSALVHRAPARQQRPNHPERGNRLGIVDILAGGREGAAELSAGDLLRAARELVVDHRTGEQHHSTDQRHDPKHRVNEPYDGDEAGRPRRVEHGENGVAADETANLGDVREPVVGDIPLPQSPRDGAGDDRRAQLRVEPRADAAEQAAAHIFENAVDNDRQDRDHGQPDQGVERSARQDAVIKLKRVNGGDQQQQVAEQAENEQRRQLATDGGADGVKQRVLHQAITPSSLWSMIRIRPSLT